MGKFADLIWGGPPMESPKQRVMRKQAEAAAAAQTKVNTATYFELPDFCLETNYAQMRAHLTPMGMLYLRLCWRINQEEGQVLRRYPVGKFGIAGVSFIDCIPIRRRDIIQVIVWHEAQDKTITIEDDINLFPSDTLLVKLRALESN